MSNNPLEQLSRRERQIMDIVYRLGQATVNAVLAELPDPPSYSSVRTHLTILEQKGHLIHEVDGPRYQYKPTVSRKNVRNSALQHLLRNFFDDSREKLVSALLDNQAAKLSDEELDNLSQLIADIKKRGD
ncbi:MAG: BlaI/MecI/CopY family transcriptional regulator [bacterium]|nr:BlaI/MecI/CopY family transcriptional regulator [bacterium]